MEKMQEAFIRAIDNGQLSHAYLFEGAKGMESGDGQGNREDAELYEANERRACVRGV